jgi:proteasome beta subunit
MSIKDGIKLAVKAILAAMKRDTATGESFDVGVIDANGYRELSEDEKNKLIEALR